MTSTRLWATLLGVAVAVSACAGQGAKPKPATAALPAIPDPPFPWPSLPAAASGSEAVRAAVLSFVWPEKLRAKETISTTSTTTLGSTPPKTTTKSYSIVMTAEAVPDGHRIVYSDVKYDMPNVTERVQAAVNASMQPLATVMFPPFIITSKGRFLRLENPEQVVADAKSLAEATKRAEADGGGSGIRITANVDENVSAETISAQMAFGWDMMIGNWNGGMLATGKEIHLRVPAADPPPSVVVYEGTGRLVGHIQCGPDQSPDSCVALELTLKADPAQYTDWLRAHLPTLIGTVGTPGAPLLGVSAATLETTLRLVTEPGTLRPHRAQWIERRSMGLELSPSKLRMDWRQQTVTVVAFEYVAS